MPAVPLSTSAGREIAISTLLDGRAAERPSGRPEPRAQHAAVGEAPREGREGQGPASQRSGRAHIQRVDGLGVPARRGDAVQVQPPFKGVVRQVAAVVALQPAQREPGPGDRLVRRQQALAEGQWTRFN